MKKITFLFLGTLMIAGGLLASCEKKEVQPERGKCAPSNMDQPCKPCSPCKRY